MSGFKIFNASAGSGKTYQLTKLYLKLILANSASQQFRSILALTFTNKAVAEMKNRILDSLYDFSSLDIAENNNPLFHDIKDEFGITAEALQKKAALTLKLVLHNYDFFEVSTIDKFTHRVIRTFAKDLQVSQSFEVELDDDVLLDAAIGRLLQTVAEDTTLQKVLIAFSLEKIEADKSWNILHDLKAIGKLLFQENHYKHLIALKAYSITDFEKLKAFLAKEKNLLFKKASELAQKALSTIQHHGFEHTDFNRQTLPNHFIKILDGERSKKLYNNKLEEGLVNGSLLLKRVEKDGAQLFIELLSIYLDVKNTIYNYLFFENAYVNILPLTVLNEIAKQVAQVQEEKELLHISEFNKLISKEINSQPVPYIYERLGERYKHYFIDEFQDTSKMQWNNLIPLIGNALETEDLNGEKGSLFLVGDAKQSIYRWRGGDPQQFINLGNSLENPFTVAQKVKTLDTNWRSYDHIVSFNNDFFQSASTFLTSKDYQQLYAEQCTQQPNYRKGGYVELNFAPQTVEEIQLFYFENVLGTIHKILDQGFAYKDICVLIRNNKNGVLLADYLTKHDVPLISSEALLLNNNAEVQFLIAILRFLDNRKEPILQFDVLNYLFGHKKSSHDYILKHLNHLSELLLNNFGFDANKVTGTPILNILEHAISCFNLDVKCGAHVFHLLDLVLELGEKNGVGIYEFLTYWDKKKEVLAIASPQNRDAIQLMTIHKSKGLEFPFVIFPFADTKLNDRSKQKKLWVPISEKTIEGPKRLLVNASDELEIYSKTACLIYEEENNLSQLDDLNVLYVAMTRAVKGLFVFTKVSKGDTYGALFQKYLEEKNHWVSNTLKYAFGEFPKSEKKEAMPPGTINIAFLKSSKSIMDKIAITSQSVWEANNSELIDWGNTIHEILANIRSIEDVENAIKSAVTKGAIFSKDEEKIKKTIHSILEHPKLLRYYSTKVNSENEMTILNIDGTTLRPDRLVFEEKKVTIIDYKTGKPNSKHKEQLHNYENILKAIGFIVDQKILIYIGQKIEPVFY